MRKFLLVAFPVLLIAGLAFSDTILRNAGTTHGPVTSLDCAVDGGLLCIRDGGAGKLHCAAASASTPGCVSTGAQTIAGAKTFSSAVSVSVTDGGPHLAGANDTPFHIRSGITDSIASSTVPAVLIKPSNHIASGDLQFAIQAADAGVLLKVTNAGNLAIGGTQISSVNTSGSLQLVSDTPDSVTTTSIPAVYIKAGDGIGATDLVLAVQGESEIPFTVDASGNIAATDLTLTGNDLTGSATGQTFRIISGANDGTTSGTVAAITLSSSVDITNADLVLEVNNSAGTQLFGVNEVGALFAATSAGTTGQVLKSFGSSTAAAWAAPAIPSTMNAYLSANYATTSTLKFASWPAGASLTYHQLSFIVTTVGAGANNVVISIVDGSAVTVCQITVSCVAAIESIVTNASCGAGTMTAPIHATVVKDNAGCTTSPAGNLAFLVQGNAI